MQKPWTVFITPAGTMRLQRLSTFVNRDDAEASARFLRRRLNANIAVRVVWMGGDHE